MAQIKQTKIRKRWGKQISYFKKENKLSKDCASKEYIECTMSPGVVAIRKNEMTFLCTQSNLNGV